MTLPLATRQQPDRRLRCSPLLDQLTQDQHKAATAQGHTLVVACPGAGKTRVLQTRATYLLERHPGATVCAVTFTRDAADELKSRIASYLTESELERVRTGTFHGLAFAQIRAAGKALPLITDNQQRVLVQRAAHRAGDVSVASAQQSIEHMKASLKPQPRSEFTHQDKAVYDAYQSMLKRYGLMDFSDILLRAAKGLIDGSVLPVPCDYMLVDEFQDADEVQHVWIDAHAAAGTKITVVGDDDQSIYGWRYARGYPGMRRFQAKHNAQKVTLATNYRSHSEILGHAEQLILQNVERMPKDLHAHRGQGGAVLAYNYPEPELEIAALADTIGESPYGWAVIARTNLILNEVQLKFDAREIPYIRPSGGSIWKTYSVSVFLALLESLANRESLGVEQAMFWCGASPALLDSPLARAAINDPTPDRLNEVSQQNGRSANLLSRLPAWRKQLERGNHINVITGVTDFMKANLPERRGDTEKKAKSDLYTKKIDQFERAADFFYKLRGSIKERLRFIKELDAKPSEEEDLNGRVHLITMHASKGLEYDHVWLPFATETVAPHKSATDISEERRLFYVGMTRAKDRLVISTSPMPIPNSKNKRPPSRFIDEAGLTLRDAGPC